MKETIQKRSIYKHRAYWQAMAEAAGYENPDAAIVGLYRKHRSLKKVAQVLGVSYGGIHHHLRLLGEPIRGPGGANNPIGLGRRRLLTYRGQTRSIAEWSRIIEIPYPTLWNRIGVLHWPVQRALSTPSPQNKARRRQCKQNN